MNSIIRYRQVPTQMLPLPLSMVPFHQQAFPLPDPLQQHFSYEQKQVVSGGYNKSNSLPTDRFLGTKWIQTNEPKYLGANERIVFEDSW